MGINHNSNGTVKLGKIAKGADLLSSNKLITAAAIATIISSTGLKANEIDVPQDVLSQAQSLSQRPTGTQVNIGTFKGNFRLQKISQNEINVYKGENLVYTIGTVKKENLTNIETQDLNKVEKLPPGPSLKRAGEGVLMDITSNASIRFGNSGVYGPTASVGYASEITKNSAIAIDVEAGEKLQRVLTTLGFNFGNGVLMFSGEHLGVKSKFEFASGEVEQMVRQNSLGTAFKMHFDKKVLKSLEISGYITKAQSYELENKEYTINNDTLFAIYDNYRNIAGGQKKGVQAKLNFEVSKKGELTLGLNYEVLEHDLKYSTNRKNTQFGGVVAYKHKFSKDIMGKVELRTGVSSTSVQAELSKRLENGSSLGVVARHTDGRNGTLNDSYVGVTYKIPLGTNSKSSSSLKNIKEDVKNGGFDNSDRKLSRIVDDVKSQNSSFKNFTTIHRVDEKSVRILEIQKDNLPEGANILNDRGDIIIDSIEVSNINNIFKNGSSYNNAGEFNIQGKHLVIITRSIKEPSKGTTDNYELNLTKLNGGSVGVSIEVQSGSIIISKITIEDLVTVVKTDLLETIKIARVKEESKYTPKSWQALQNSLKIAVDIFNNDKSTQEEVDNATIQLKKDVNQLQERANFNTLQTKLLEAQDIVKNSASKYTHDSIVNLNQAIILAQTTLTNLDSTQKEVDDVITLLQTSINDLVIIVIDKPTNIGAPGVSNVTYNSVNILNNITDADGIKDIKYYLYSDNSGSTLIATNNNGVFSSLTPNKIYFVKTSAQTLNTTTQTWELRNSNLVSFQTLTAPIPETPPIMLNVPNQTYTSGTAISNLTMSSYVTLTDGDPITAYTLSGTLPTGLSFNPTTGVLSGTPTQLGTFNMSITATDNDGVSNSKTFTITVNSAPIPETPPTMGNVPNQTYTSGTAISNLTMSSYVTLTDGDPITAYTLSGTLPTGLSFNPTTGVLSGTPTQLGTFNMSITATDNDGVSNSKTFTITVNSAPIPETPPTMGNVPNQTYTSGTAISNLAMSSYVTLTDGDPITAYTLSGTLPTGLSFNTTTGVLSGTPTQLGTFNMSITATDNDGVSNSKTFTITVNAIVDTLAPTISSFTINGSGTNPITNNSTISIAASGTDNTGITGWFIKENNSTTPDKNDAGWQSSISTFTLGATNGSRSMTIWAKDAAGNISSPSSLNVFLDNVAPTIKAGWPQYTINGTGGVDVMVELDGVWGANDSGAGAPPSGWTGGNGSSSYYKTYTSNTTETVTFQDAAGNTVTQVINVTLIDNTPPTITSGASLGSVNVGDNFSKTITFSEPVQIDSGSLSGDLVAFGSTSLPPGSVTSWTVTGNSSTSGTKNLNFKITDAAGNPSNVSVSLTVVGDITPPILNSDNINLGSNTNGTGTLTFNENTTLSGLSLVKASDDSSVGGSVGVNSGTGTPNLTLSISTPNLSGEFVKIKGTATDDAGNSTSFETSPWML